MAMLAMKPPPPGPATAVKYMMKVADKRHRSAAFQWDLLVPDSALPNAPPAPGAMSTAEYLRVLGTDKLDEVMAAGPWVCSAGDDCDLPAVTLVQTLGFFGGSDGAPFAIHDMCPVPVCASAACRAEARRQTDMMIAEVQMGLAANGAPTGSAARRRACDHCGKHDPPGGGALKACTRCQRVHYCDRDCQRAHWKAHKKDCAPQLADAG